MGIKMILFHCICITNYIVNFLDAMQFRQDTKGNRFTKTRLNDEKSQTRIIYERCQVMMLMPRHVCSLVAAEVISQRTINTFWRGESCGNSTNAIYCRRILSRAYVGDMVTTEDLRPTTANMTALREAATLTNVTELHNYLGLLFLPDPVYVAGTIERTDKLMRTMVLRHKV